MIHLSETAIARIEKFMKKNPDAIGIYIHIIHSGCAGYSYQIELAYTISEQQQAFIYPTFQIIIDTKDLSILDSLFIDVIKKGFEEKFAFTNPQAQITCGCGNSFSI